MLVFKSHEDESPENVIRELTNVFKGCQMKHIYDFTFELTTIRSVLIS